MTREEKIELLNKLLEIEEKADIGNLTRAERGEFQQWVNDAFEPCEDATLKDIFCMGCEYKEQEPCEDAISRQAVLDKIKEVCFSREQEWVDFRASQGSNGQRDLIISFIEDLPNVQPKPKTEWIPVSESLPEDGAYLVTVERIDGEPGIDIKSFAKDLHKVDDFDFPKHKCGWYDYDSEYGYWEDTKVIAWMPLPEPYRAESENKE